MGEITYVFQIQSTISLFDLMTSPEEGLEGWGHKWKDTSSTEEPEETSGNVS